MTLARRGMGVTMAALLLVAGCAGAEGVPIATEISPTDTAPLPTDTLRPTVASTATLVPERVPPERPLLLTHFMPWYQTPEVSGYWGWHWTMEHFDPDTVDAEGHPEIASYTLPLTGPYDSRDPAILEYQVLLMKLSGIDGVIVDWYGIEAFWDYGVLNESTHALFDAVKAAGLQFAICYEDQSIKHMVDNKHLPSADVYTHGQDVMRAMEADWFGDDAYLKVEGQPALFTFGPQYFKNASDWDKLFSVLTVRPAFFTLDGHTESAATAAYPWPPMWASKEGVLTQEALTDYLTGFYAKAQEWPVLVGGAFPGFHDIYKDAGVSAEERILDARDGATFGETLQLALEQQPDMIQLITWNDYGEDTTIEPTEEYGYRYLEVVQETRRATDPEPFPYTPDDLRLPLLLFQLRKAHVGDGAVNTELDTAVTALLSGDAAAARAILEGYAAP